MFGKIIHLKRDASGVEKDGELPAEITRQFKSDVLERGLRLAEASRISHINFGREFYFGLVSEGGEKGVNVHISLDPEAKTLTKATCGCFRSNTRTYCHHIVSFIKYILRGDPETARLRTLGEDFNDSFWYDFSWYAYRNFSDSILGFRAEVNPADDIIRINFSDRGAPILSFMPGIRLIGEFLHEFFEIIRRDIDPGVFRRIYGKKLKDPNVPSLRRRPWQYSDSEDEINRRGLKSIRQHFEDSMWHKIAKVGFLIAGREGGYFRFKFVEHKQELIIEACDADDNVIIRFTPPRNHIGALIEIGERSGAIGSDIYINPMPLKTGYSIGLSETSALGITPIVENPDAEDAGQPPYLDRTEMEHQLYGSYYYFSNSGFHRISVNISGLPAEYFSPQKTTIVPPEDITHFISEFGEMLKAEPYIFLDEAILDRQTIEHYEKAVIDHKGFGPDGVILKIDYDYGGFTVGLREIYEARSEKRRFVVRGDKWIDTETAEFTWLAGISPEAITEDNILKIERIDYLKILAYHDRLEKKFASTKLKTSFNALETLKPPGRLPSIKGMKGKLRPYQKNGFGWLWFLYENEFSGLLCDDMGLGKTHQIMALMTGISRRVDKAPHELKFLVVCPTTVLSHWKEKLTVYCPDLDPYIYHGTDRSFSEAFEEHSLIITSYGIALRDVEMLSLFRYDLMVLDEVQAIKNKSTKTYAAIRNLESVCSIGLTGTPIENSVTDLKALFDVVLPGYLMTDSLFERQFRAPIEDYQDSGTREKLAKMIQPFTLRRKKEQVLTELPPKIEDVRRCVLSEDQIRFYKDVANNQGQNLVQKLKDPGQNVPYMHVFAILNYLKQICDHPSLIEGSFDYTKYTSGKWDLFTELLQESLGSGQKVVVFSQYVKMLGLLERYLTDNQIKFATIKGTTRNRGEAIRRFNNDPDCMVFSASLRASGLGIDLTAASVVIHYDRWWNSAREDQATDRVHRIGQSRGVQVFKLLTENTLEEKIDVIISRKRKLMESVVKEDDQSMLKRFSREELIELVSFYGDRADERVYQ